MKSCRLTITAAALCLLTTSPSWAQPGILKEKLEGQKTLPRRPNDNLEGTLWQYRATRKGSEDVLSGRFRIDEQLVFSTQSEIDLPKRPGRSGGRPVRPLPRLASGQGGTAKLPSEPTQRRIGECKTLSSGRVRIDFQPDSGLEGYMIIRPKKDATDVWWGTFQAMDGKKKKLRWDVELRKAED